MKDKKRDDCYYGVPEYDPPEGTPPKPRSYKLQPNKESLESLRRHEPGEHYQFADLVQSILWLAKEIEEIKKLIKPNK